MAINKRKLLDSARKHAQKGAKQKALREYALASKSWGDKMDMNNLDGGRGRGRQRQLGRSRHFFMMLTLYVSL